MAVEIMVRLLTEGALTGIRKRGEVITVKPVPNSGWGIAECPPRYAIVRIEGMDYEEAKEKFVRHYSEEDPDGIPDKDTGKLPLKFTVRSKQILDVDNLSTELKTKLDVADAKAPVLFEKAAIEAKLIDVAAILNAEILAEKALEK